MKWVEYPEQSIDIDNINYPRDLNKLTDPPTTLYYRGTLSKSILRRCLAIVGSRRMSRYGKAAAERLTGDLVAAGVTIVSGFMYGVDAVAHSVAVEGKGRTIAVLGSGINQIYPPDHDILYTSILENGGVVLSEFKPEQKPKPWMYAKRNRIVAALANMGVIVIEASVKSGSLITADYANKLQRPVYALPGPINSSTSEGTNWLIKTGKAKLITNINDIKGIKKLKKEKLKNNSPLSPVESKILEILKIEGAPLSADEIVALSGMTISEVSMQISMMHLKGLLSEVDGKYAVND